MLQKEVVERILAKPGKMSLLSASVQFYAEPELITKVPSKDFYPSPKVESAVIKIVLRKENLGQQKFGSEFKEKLFWQLLKFGFSAKRKMLKKNLSAGYRIPIKIIEESFEKSGISNQARAQDLSLENWLNLFGYILKNVL